MQVARTLALSVVALVALVAIGSAQPAHASAQTPPGTLGVESYASPQGLVEVLGLRRWTLDMLRDSVRARRPGVELHDAACMVVLRDSLGFPDALVRELNYAARANARAERFLVIKLVEPGDTARVRWVTTASVDSFRVLRPSFAPLILGAADSAGSFRPGALLYPLQFGADTVRLAALISRMPPARRAVTVADVERVRAFRAAHAGEASWRAALRTLGSDGVYANRVAAAVVLAGFPERDSTWRALVSSLRDGNQTVRTTALTVLEALPATPIDWAPAVPALRALLGGTNLEASEAVFRTLARTRVAPTLAAPLLRGNSDWVLAHLRARTPGAAESARALLVQLHGGVDLGSDPAAWTQWLGELPSRDH